MSCMFRSVTSTIVMSNEKSNGLMPTVMKNFTKASSCPLTSKMQIGLLSIEASSSM